MRNSLISLVSVFKSSQTFTCKWLFVRPSLNAMLCSFLSPARPFKNCFKFFFHFYNNFLKIFSGKIIGNITVKNLFFNYFKISYPNFLGNWRRTGQRTEMRLIMSAALAAISSLVAARGPACPIEWFPPCCCELPLSICNFVIALLIPNSQFDPPWRLGKCLGSSRSATWRLPSSDVSFPGKN